METPRIATISRKTKETDISITLTLDGSGKTDISTGIGFSTICWMGFHVTDSLI